MPTRDSRLSPEPEHRELLERELAPHLRELRRTRVDYSDVVSRVVSLAEYAGGEPAVRWLTEVVVAT
jgi:hypothetical protein